MINTTEYIYCLDASAFIDMVHLYPELQFPGLWRCMANLVAEKRLIMVDPALKECKDPESQHWLKLHINISRNVTLEVQNCLRVLLKDLNEDGQWLVRDSSTNNQADPFVIALAMSENMTATGSGYSSGPVVVVHHESRTMNATGRVKLADVCGRYSIISFKLLDIIRQEKWVFK